MDSLQLLLASLLVLIICLIVWFNNSLNRVKQPKFLKWVGLLAVASTVYFYTKLDRNHFDCIWGVTGGSDGAIGGDINGGDDSLIVDLASTPVY